MGKPDKKLKKKILILGITGAVYGSFRYLLPLIIPFLLAYGIASVLRPSAKWLTKRLRIRRKIRGKYRGIPIGVIGAVELILLLAIILTGIYFGGRKLCMEACLLVEQIPVWLNHLDEWMTGVCHQMEMTFCMNEDELVLVAREMITGLIASVKHGAMPYIMANSVTMLKIGTEIIVMMVILIIATALTLQEMDRWKARWQRCAYQVEIEIVLKRLHIVCHAYLKTQGIIMMITMCICMAGFWILRNPYYILAGVGLGLLDALPIFGTGTVLIPWAIISFVQGKWGVGIMLLFLYIVCYFIREILEAKMMGEQVGLSSLEMLIAMIVGLQLFGIPGFLLGPVGLLLIMDFSELLE